MSSNRDSRRPVRAALLVAALLAATGLAADEPEIDRAAVIAAFAEALESRTPLRLVEVIENLDGRYGTFADLDGDGDLDYVATEMIHGREPLATHLKTESGWRRKSRTSRPFNQKHPFIPWIVPAHGKRPLSILLPTGWPPYLYLIPTDGRGRLRVGRARALDGFLPDRISRPYGVDNCPYSVLEIVPACDGDPPKAVGLIEDWAHGQERIGSWTILFDERRVLRRPTSLPADHWSRRLDWRAEYPIERPAVHPDDPPEHAAAELRSRVLRLRLLDIDGDGLEDLVQLTADFALHVRRGVRDEATGAFRLEEEQEAPRGLPLGRVLRDLWGGVDLDSLLADAGYWLDVFGYELRENAGGPVPVSLAASYASEQVLFTWDGTRMTTHLRRADFAPRDESGKLLWARVAFGDRDLVSEDFDGDGTPETLTVITMAVGEQVDEKFPLLQPLVMYWRSDAPLDAKTPIATDEPATLLLEFPERVREPRNHNGGRPLTLERVPISGTDRERYCVYFREWRTGLFLERADVSRSPAPAAAPPVR